MIRSIENSAHYKWGTNSDGWHLLEADDLSVIEENVPPGEKEVRHYHNKSQQFNGELQIANHNTTTKPIFKLFMPKWGAMNFHFAHFADKTMQ